MGILSTNKKIINLGQGYSAGSGISIDDYVISVTGDTGTTYSAGQNIDIYDDQGQLYISGKDWSADIADASANAYNTTTAWVVENYDNSSAVDYISGVVDNISSNVNNINSAIDYYSGSIDYISSTVDNKLDTTAWSTISGDYATTSYVDMNDDLTYDRTTAWVDQNYVADSEISDASGVWNDTSDCVQTNSGAWANGGGIYDVVTANSANWNNVSSKLDISSFESYTATVASGDYELSAGVGISLYDDALNEITRIDVTGSFDNEEVNQVVETNSAAWSNNPGDVNVNNYVYNNSAINDAVNGLVSSNSASWNGKLNKSDFDTYSGNVNGYIARLYDNDSYFSGAIDYLSGNAGKTYTGISPIVVNNTTNEISADSQDITFGEGLDFTNGVLTVTAGGGGTTYTGDAQGALDEVYANSGVWLTAHQVIPSSKWEEASTEYEQNSATYLTAHQDISNKLDTTAFSTVSGNFLTAVDLTPYYTTADANTLSSMLSGAIDYVSANAGDEFPASANEAITAYQNASGTYLTAHQPISANEWNSNYDTVISNSASWGGTPLPMSAGEGIDIQIENDTLVISATGGAGNPEVESYVQTNSASIDDAVSTYETNSGTYLTAHQPISANEWNSNYDTVITNSGVWGGSALQISAGPGIKLDMVNNTLVASTDETVLFQNGSISTKSATLSEPITNFKKIGVLCGDDHYGNRYVETDTSYPYCKWITNYGFDYFNTGSNMIGFRELAWSAGGNEIYAVSGWQKSIALTSTGSWNAGYSGVYGGIIKVVGINRINSI